MLCFFTESVQILVISVYLKIVFRNDVFKCILKDHPKVTIVKFDDLKTQYEKNAQDFTLIETSKKEHFPSTAAKIYF